MTSLPHLLWKLKKLPTMGPKEVLARLGGKMSEHRERFGCRTGAFNWSSTVWRRRLCRWANAGPGEGDLAAWWRRHLNVRSEPPFLLNAASLKESSDLYRRLFSDRLPEAVERAERVCRGEFSLLGIDFTVPDPFPWQQDPQSKKNWPTSFYADIHIPFCDGKGSRGTAGDVKYVWELNRHEFLIDRQGILPNRPFPLRQACL